MGTPVTPQTDPDRMATTEKNSTGLAANSIQQQSIWIPRDASLLTVIALDTLLTILCVCIIASCVVAANRRRAKRKEERDKLGLIIQNYFWECEEQIVQLLQVIHKMRETVIFRDVTELHLLGYKYRNENSWYGLISAKDTLLPHTSEGKLPLPYTSPVLNTQKTVKMIERLFESLAIQLPCEGRCPPNIARAFSSNLYNVAQSTSILWSDHKARLVKTLILYFAGRTAAERFEGSLISDEELETLVLARVPYVTQLCLKLDHFVLKEVDISNDLKIDMRNKIRYVDTVLAKNEKLLQMKEKNVMESYYLAREICLKNNFIQNKNYFPDIVSKVGEPSKVGECVVYLRHLLRLMCTSKNIRKLESDDKFFQFLMQLYEALYTWSDTKTMLEVIERSRNNIFSYLRGLTVEQILMDKEFTKAKLEHVEKELYRHLNYLTVKQVQEEKDKRHPLRRADTDPKMRSVDSDSSIYTMAMSTSSFLMKRQHSQDRADRDLELLHQQASIDQTSLLSGSSMYATAASLSSVNENAPLMGRSPPTPHKGDELDRQQSPTSEGSDFFETAV